MKDLQVGVSYEGECFIVGYFTEDSRTNEEVVIPFTEVTPALSELLSFLEPALEEQSKYKRALAKEIDRPKRSVALNGRVYERSGESIDVDATSDRIASAVVWELARRRSIDEH